MTLEQVKALFLVVILKYIGFTLKVRGLEEVDGKVVTLTELVLTLQIYQQKINILTI